MKNGIANLLAILFLSIWAPIAQAQELTLPQAGNDPIVLHVPEDPAGTDMLWVHLPNAETAMAGRYVVSEHAVAFIPAFGFEPGQTYVAKTNVGPQSHAIFRLPGGRSTAPAEVTEVFPSGDTLPENTLRFYIHFSVPMQPQIAFDYIKLRDASGNDDDAAFMRFKQELWNEDRTRLTVLIDPGRIKREVATNVELGPALRAGRRYTLIVEGGWPSADGSSELPAFSKTFQVSDALRSVPDTNHWSTNLPCGGTRAPLTVAFDRPFDRHLLTQSLRLQTSEDRVIEGEIEVGGAERLWRLTPTQPWPSGKLRLIADTSLEDVAGNNFHDLLDHLAGQEDGGTTRSELLIETRSCAG